MKYEHLFFLVIGAIAGYCLAFWMQNMKIKILQAKINALEENYKLLIESHN